MAVSGGPMRRNLCNRFRTVTLEPCCLLLTSRHFACQSDLEGTLSERQFRKVWLIICCVLVDQAVQGINLPVQFLLLRDQLSLNACEFTMGGVECISKGNVIVTHRLRRVLRGEACERVDLFAPLLRQGRRNGVVIQCGS